ncbi:Putative Dihydrolipoamide dehydrogenase (EC / Mercuric ion reductase (EC / PF00070 family [Amycolatopsis camponoti]|uniref:Dihydrolipoamide dehydrogenase ) n=1 Tax=Amycolatopsis camponoti TaxID=2606593 RepID=A0A6I8LV57_9PSEU|nr:FAD-dependent oxidoreductase [Amycolatopsis camponoti]VVJ19485.1 Putative Dihydrolipoamide dehydrogenase (EC / Mercuric ion reductase (EC / PF00070 family [Amycolatopsis camponoti]
MEKLTADVLVIGFGKGGKTAAHALSDAGRRVVLVERSANMYGGTCPNVGCVPTKMLFHYSNGRRVEDDAQEFFAHSIAGVRALTSAFRAGNFASLDGKNTATVITGTARFVDQHTVAVGEGDDLITVTAPTIILSTGSAPVIAPIPGLATSKHLVSSTELTQAATLPERLIVVGGGYLGLEFASIYQHFGTHVTVLEGAERLLPREDEDIAGTVREILEGDGVRIITGAKITEVEDSGAVAKVSYEKDGQTHSVEASALLPATGRRPVTDGLRLDAAGVRTTPDGAVQVDEHLRTSRPHIYAVGDVNGGPQFTYVALDDARIVLDQLLGEGKRTTADRVAVPHTLFTTPPLATVGLTEREARARGLNIKVASEKVADIVAMPRAYTVEETRGMMKFVVDADTDLILGAALLSIDAQEVVNTVALAIRHDITATELRNSIYTHPSSTEAFNEVFGKASVGTGDEEVPADADRRPGRPAAEGPAGP